ncbi:MAG TPA: hypothetical protein VHG28_01660 [Longimicrobiaceae bacterium]|nr:hypothetical protein [Longimicrobiaceae bacterium]
MPKSRLLPLAAVLAGLAACQENKEAPATHEPSEAPTPEAITPASGASGPDVGAAGADATAAAAPGDTATTRAAHP